MAQRISIGIVNYNGGAHLLKCVESAFAQKNISAKVFVYDNASTDHSLDGLSGIPGITCLRGTENRGYAFACNRLIEAMEAEFVTVANMDLLFDPSWAEQVCAAFDSHPEADSVASMVLEQGDPVTVNFAGMGFFPDLHPQSIFAGADPAAISITPAPIFGAYGAVMVFRKSLFETIGYFDEDYFLFYEETEFFWRMNIYGRSVLFWPPARVLHYRSLITTRFSPLKLFYSERNRIYTGLKILPYRRYPGLFFWSLYRLVAMRCKVNVSQKAKMKETGASPFRIVLTIISAWFSALLKLPSIAEKRRRLFSGSGAAPEKTVEILDRYRIPWKYLTLK